VTLLHVYDHTYYQANGQTFSNGAFTQDAWHRYLRHFDRLTVVGNPGKLGAGKSIDRMNKVDLDKVSFQLLPSLRHPVAYLKSFLKIPDRLRKLIDSHDAIAIRVPGEMAFFAANYCRQQGKPYALEVVGCPWDAYWNHGSLAGTIMAPHMWARMKNAVSRATHVIYVTQAFLQRRYPNQAIQAAASNVMLATGTTDQVLNKKQAALRRAENPLKIGMVAGLAVRYKGFKEAILALGAIKDKIPPFQLMLVGPGDGSWLLPLAEQSGISKQLKIIGRLSSGPAIFNFLDGLDLYLHPSKQEGLPRSLIEAMSRACPALASSVAGIPELLPSDYLHSPGDYKSLAHQLAEVLNDPELRATMAAKNFKVAKGYYPDVLARKRADFWGEFATYVSIKTT